MTPKLEQLFSDMWYGYRTPISTHDDAYDKIHKLLHEYGEELVDVLEQHVKVLTQFEAGLVESERKILNDGRELLAQIDKYTEDL
jgi:hypothetical protein